MNLRSGCTVLALLLVAPLAAHASCDTVKASIDAKIKANGVSAYTLDVVPAGESATSGKVVGQCEGDKQIVYTRGEAAPAKADATPEAQPGAKPAVAAEPTDGG